jgi:CRISPR-associated protein Cmr5
MSKKNVEAYIPKVLEELKLLEKMKKEDKDELRFPNGIPSSYNGYISSFGASIIQSGLLPTLALFENTNSKTAQEKKLLTDIILNVLSEEYQPRSLLRYVLEQKDVYKVKQEIINISIAIKLTIRTFKLDKGEKNE